MVAGSVMRVGGATRWLAGLTLMMALMVSGCSNPCATIADKACANAGAESSECTRLQKVAARASTEERRSCEVALNLVESLEKVQ